MKLFNKEKCIHHWHYVGKATMCTEDFCSLNTEMVALFCPKCEEETTVADERWEQLQEIQKIRESYHKTVKEAAEITNTPTRRILKDNRVSILGAYNEQ